MTLSIPDEFLWEPQERAWDVLRPLLADAFTKAIGVGHEADPDQPGMEA